jgi:hypothetical protein
MVAAAADSLAAMRDYRKLGTAIAMMMRIMATTITISMSVNPLLLRIALPHLGLTCLTNPREALHFACRTQILDDEG